MANSDHHEKPVAIFNASTRLGGFSQNAAFSLLAAWGLQLAGNPVVHFTCHSGMSRCVLGVNIDNPSELPPCKRCVGQSKRLLASANIYWFTYQHDQNLFSAIKTLGIEDLSRFSFDFDGFYPKPDYHLGIQKVEADTKIPLGSLVLPALRWALRRHDLLDDEPTLNLLRTFIQSAYSVAISFAKFLDQVDPGVVVIFNGIMYPEAAARWVANKRGLRVITHEVGFQPFSAFFTDGQATAYPMHIPEAFELTSEQNERLDGYLSQRFKGEFTMAGIRFWPQIRGLDRDFMKHASHFDQIVSVFTNVVNDTSQVHASTVFNYMYDWLAHLVEIIRDHPDALFVIRAHPDEKRRGTRKHSRQPVSDWVGNNKIDQLPNVIFVDSNEPVSSYELIQQSKFVCVYNSSIGLEAALLGVPVLCGGKARYTQYPTVYFPQTPGEYKQKAEEFLSSDEIIIPSVFQRNARRILYWQLYRASLPFDQYLNPHPTPGYVQLKNFSWRDLLAENSPLMGVLVKGIMNGEPFLLPDSSDQGNNHV